MDQIALILQGDANPEFAAINLIFIVVLSLYRTKRLLVFLLRMELITLLIFNAFCITSFPFIISMLELAIIFIVITVCEGAIGLGSLIHSVRKTGSSLLTT